MRRRTRNRIVDVLLISDSFSDICIWRRQGWIDWSLVNVKAGIDALANRTSGNTRFCFNFLPRRDAPVNAGSHSVSIVSAARTYRSEQLIVAGRDISAWR